MRNRAAAEMSAKTTLIKTVLIQKGWGDAIELLNVIQKNNKVSFDKWLHSGFTTLLMDMAEPYKAWAIYANRTDVLPFFNDICAIDSAFLAST